MKNITVHKTFISLLGISTSLASIIMLQQVKTAYATCSVVAVDTIECVGTGTGYQNSGLSDGSVTVLSGSTEDGTGSRNTIHVGNANKITIERGGEVVDYAGSSRDGVNAGANNTITNDGLIDVRRYGLDVGNGTTINNNGKIISNNHIVNAEDNDNITINNMGIMQNRHSTKGIWLQNNGLVFNGSANDGSALISGGDDAILFRDNGTLINYGAVRGGDPASGSPGGESDGVDIYSGGDENGGGIENYGTITTLSSSNQAVEVSSTREDQVLWIHNHGYIGAARGIWEFQQGQESITRGVQHVINYDGGTIESTLGVSGFALKLGDDNDSYEIHGASRTIGIADGGRNENFGGQDDDRFILGGSIDATFDADMLSGNFGMTLYRQWENLDKTGSSTWTVDASNSPFNGRVDIIEGTLINNGRLDNAYVTVSGGNLAGSGSSSNVSVAKNGIHNPGQFGASGHYTVHGNYLIESNGFLEVDLEETGAGDQVIVNGSVEINGGTLTISELPGTWNSSQIYVLIDNNAADAVTGTFGTVTNRLAFLDPVVDYAGGDGNDVVLTLVRNNNTFADGDKDNQTETENGLDDPIINGIIAGMTPEEAQDALDALSGEIHGVVNGALARHSSRTFKTIGDRIANTWVMTGGLTTDNNQSSSSNPNLLAYDNNTPTPNMETVGQTLSFWTQSSGEWRTIESDGNGAEQDIRTYDVLMGADITSENQLTFGIFGGYGNMAVELDNRDSVADIHTGRAGAYLAYLQPHWQASAMASYAFHQVDTRRNIDFLTTTARADYDAHEFAVQGKMGYTGQVSGLFFHPSVGISTTWLHNSGYSEIGAGAANLVADSDNTHSIKSSIGIKIASEVQTENMILLPEAEILWHHEFGDVNGSTVHQFESSVTSFSVEGAEPSRDTLEMTIGLQARFDNGVASYLNASAILSEDERSFGVRGGFRFLF